MVWTGISKESRTELLLVRGGSLTGTRYVDEILEAQVLTILNEVSANPILIHDKPRIHIAYIVQSFYK